MAQIAYSTITITDTNDIERIYVVYAKHTSNTNSSGLPVETSWKESIAQAPGSGNYIWQRTVIKKSGVTTLIYGNPVCVTGPQGIQGPEGDAATNITNIQVQYGTSADWNTQPSSWNNSYPDYDSTTPKYWTRTRLVYEDNSYSDWVVTQDYVSTEAIATATDAWDKADQAQTNASQAIEETALLGGHFIYKDSTSESGLTPPSANVVQTVVIEGDPEDPESENIDVTDDPTQWGYNVHIGSNGIKLRKNELTLSDWTENALTFYLPYSNPQEISTQLTQNGMIVNQGGIINNKLSYFLTLDTAINPNKDYYTKDENTDTYTQVTNPDVNNIENYYEYGVNERVKLFLSTEGYGTNYTINNYETDKWRQIIGRYFGVTDEGYLYCSGAYISGKLDVMTGSNVYTKNESQAYLTEVVNITGANQWKNKYGSYILTEDEVPNENTIYYQAIYDYFPTDTVYDVNKDYYIQIIETDEEQIQTIRYERVTTPIPTDIENYFEYGITGYKAIDLQPEDNPSLMGLYILNTISESINDYVQTHLSVEEDGMWIRGGYNYSLTTDVEIDPNKIYYTKILGTNNYEKVVNPIIADISTYYEQNEQYKIQINNNGMMVYDPSNNLVSTFGENIEFSSSKRQKIGGENAYIEFDPTNGGKLIVNASELHISGNDIENRFSQLQEDYQNDLNQIDEKFTSANTTLTQSITNITDSITAAQLNELKGYIDINSNESTMRIGKKNVENNSNNSYIEINAHNPADMRVSINMQNKVVAYFNNERLYAPSAVVTNLYMQTKTGEGRVIGKMGWLMRSNGHLSLKEITTDDEEN